MRNQMQFGGNDYLFNGSLSAARKGGRIQRRLRKSN